MIQVIDLFAGIGGFSYGLKKTGGFTTVCYVEKEPYAQEVLLRRMEDGHLDMAPIVEDIRSFRGDPWRGRVDLITGGFPCQDISAAGRRAGIREGTRSGLWFEFKRVIEEVRPSFVIIENVAGLRSKGGGLGVVLDGLSQIGYDAEWHSIPAAAVGAPHQRDRVWVVAYPRCQPGDEGAKEQEERDSCDQSPGRGGSSEVAHPQGEQNGRVFEQRVRADVGRGCEMADCQKFRWEPRVKDKEGSPSRDKEREKPRFNKCCPPSNPTKQRLPNRSEETMGEPQAEQESERSNWWAVEPDVGRLAHGIPFRVDRLRSLGNAIVPQIAEYLGNRLLKLGGV